MSNWYYSCTGGSGAGYHAKIVISQTGQYELSVGSGGTGRGGAKGEYASGTNASASTIKTGGLTIISAGGGTGAGTNTVGIGGVLTKDASLVEETVYTSTNGQNGNGGGTGAAGTAGPISGHTWGGSGYASAGSAGGGADPSYHGYIMIKYVGPSPDMYTFTINPTPSDATVTLTVDGNTYAQNSIIVVSGKTVSWTVSKSGYITQTGNNTITEDTIEGVSLVQADPLYYCYSLNNYYYYFTPYPTPGQREMYFKTNWTRAYSASEIGNHLTITVSSVTSSTLTYGSTTLNRFAEGDLYT